MKKLTIQQIAGYAGAEVFSDNPALTAGKVVRDSREAVEGTVFFALKGEKADGNIYAVKACEKGTRMLVMSDRDRAEEVIAAYPDAGIILAEDTLKAMQELAKNYLADCDIIKVAVTGSTGKTSTKEMLSAIFASKYRTISNFENYNNHIGVPLTVFEVDETTEAGIFEMGMNHAGEISLLSEIVKPESACITNIGISHIGNLGGKRENILKAKLEVADFMPDDGTLVFNCDNDMLSKLLEAGDLSKGYLPAGEKAPEYGMVIGNVKDNAEKGITFTLTFNGETQEFEIPLPGVHNAWNASLAVAAGIRYGITMTDAAEALKHLTATGNRLNIKENNGIKVINDAYNSSPDSVKAALDVLVNMKCERRVAILGDMLELGEGTNDFHRQIGQYAAKKGIDVIMTVGDAARFVAEGVLDSCGGNMKKPLVMSFENREGLTEGGLSLLREGDAVLIKASHGLRLDLIAPIVLKEN